MHMLVLSCNVPPAQSTALFAGQPQVSEQSKVLAEQATSYSAAAAEHASHLSKAAAVYSEEARTQLAGMQLPDALANLQVTALVYEDGSHYMASDIGRMS